MWLQEYKASNFIFETIDVPPKDNIMMEKISKSIIYNKYVKEAHSSETFKKKFDNAITQNHFLNAKVKDLETEREYL